jgi:hypothetical protein
MIIGGDFNIIIYLKEKNTMDGVHRHTALFNSLIHFYGLRELTMNGGLFHLVQQLGTSCVGKVR